MYSSRAFEVINTLNNEELKRLSKFVRSPYHNSNKNLVTLFEQLKSRIGKEFKSVSIFSKVFPGKKFNQQVLNNLSSEFYQVIREFLIIENLKQSQGDSTILLLRNLESRLLDNIFRYEMDKVFDREKAEFRIEELSHLQRAEIINQLIAHIYYRDNLGKTSHLSAKSGFESLIAFLNSASSYLSQLRTSEIDFNVNSKDFIFREFMESIDFDAITTSLNKKSFENDLLKYYLIQIKDFEKRAKDQEWELKFIEQFYKKYSKRFTPSMRFDILHRWKLMLTYLVIIGQREKIDETALVIKLMMKEKLLIAPGDAYLPYVEFRNNVRILTLANDFHARARYIEASKEFLNPEIKDDIYKVTLAEIYKSQYNFKKAIELYSSTKNLEIVTKYDVRFNLLECYFQENMVEEFYDAYRSNKKFLKTNKEVTDIHRVHNENYLDVMKKIVDIKLYMSTDKEKALYELDKLKDFVENVERINIRDSLLGRIGDLKKNLENGK